MKYIAQCTSGLQQVVAHQLLKEPLPSVVIHNLEEGLVVFESDAKPHDLVSISYINNSFGVISDFGGRELGINEVLNRIGRDKEWAIAARRFVTPKERTFRVFLSVAGKLLGGGSAMATIVDRIAQSTSLRYASKSADTEFWIIRRRSGLTFFCKRLTRRVRTESDLQKGELRPELARLLCLLSEPSKDDIFLDPFAGSGAIPFARANLPYNMMYILDSDEDAIRRIKQDIKNRKKIRERKGSPIIARVADARSLDRFQDGHVHKIVTDPPWGIYDSSIEDIQTFYRQTIAELIRVTRDAGLIVMLIGQKKVADLIIAEGIATLEPVVSYDILVNGRKASLIKLRRRVRV
jgi:23S rRNA G2445 N2-methylase RlmL